MWRFKPYALGSCRGIQLNAPTCSCAGGTQSKLCHYGTLVVSRLGNRSYNYKYWGWSGPPRPLRLIIWWKGCVFSSSSQITNLRGGSDGLCVLCAFVVNLISNANLHHHCIISVRVVTGFNLKYSKTKCFV